jgi:hypothetical protein
MTGTLSASPNDDAALQSAISESIAETVAAESSTGSETPQDALSGVSDETTSQNAPDVAQNPATEAEAPEAVDAQTSPDSDATDPLAGAEPFTYSVDGQARTMDGVYRIPNEGLIVPEDKVADFQRIVSRAESLERTNRQLYDQTKAFEKLTQWTTKDASGKDVSLNGQQAIEAMQIAHAQTKAALSEIVKVLMGSPTDYLMQNAQGEIVWNQRQVEYLLKDARFAERDAADKIRSQFQGIQAELSKPPEVDVAQSAPQLLDSFASTLQLTLHSDDKTFLASMLPQFVRPTAPEDIAQNPALANEPRVVDARFLQLMQRTAEQRAQSATTQKATQFNQAVTAGKKPAQPPGKTAPKAQPSKPAQLEKKGRAQTWDDIFQQGMAELGGLP